MRQFFKTFFKIFFVIILFAVIALAGAGAYIFNQYVNAGDTISLSELKLNFTSFVYCKDPVTGEYKEMERLFDTENRVWVSIDKIPQSLKDAIISIEDERFESHKGVDIQRTTSATINYVLHGQSTYGASTITQQLIKNVTGDDDVSPERKIKEMARAIALEKRYTKDDILEMYLNTIYLSQGCNGVQSAANLYFNKDVKDLTLAESASIAGITQFPSKFDPFVHPEDNISKQHVILAKMLELGKITQQEYDEAYNTLLEFKKPTAEKKSKQTYFVDQVILEVLSDLQKEKGLSKALASKMLFSGGLKIYATIDTHIQEIMDRVYADDESFPKMKDNPPPESAMIIVDPYNGEIKGVVGGRGEKSADRTLNRATQTTRQPGSTIKPLAVYAPAIEYGLISPTSIFNDERIDMRINGDNWSPKNYYAGFRGPMSVKSAIAISTNTVAVRVLEKVTLENSFNFMRDNLGITTLVDREKRGQDVFTDKNLSSLALGGLTDGLSVMEVAGAYSAFVNKGVYTRPYSYTKVLDNNDNPVLEKKPNSIVAMSEQTAFFMNDMLQEVVKTGTGTPAQLPNIAVAGKTGTTDKDNDRWFVGYTPYYVGVVWFGFDQPKKLPDFQTNPALAAWKLVMKEVHEDLGQRTFPESKGIVQIRVCSGSGLLATSYCKDTVLGMFRKGAEPTKRCDIHTAATVPRETNAVVPTAVPRNPKATIRPVAGPKDPVQTAEPNQNQQRPTKTEKPAEDNPPPVEKTPKPTAAPPKKTATPTKKPVVTKTPRRPTEEPAPPQQPQNDGGEKQPAPTPKPENVDVVNKPQGDAGEGE